MKRVFVCQSCCNESEEWHESCPACHRYTSQAEFYYADGVKPIKWNQTFQGIWGQEPLKPVYEFLTTQEMTI